MAFDRTRPFTRAQALAAGIGAGELKGPRCRRLLPGVYASAAIPDSPLLIAQAALARFPPTAYASHTTAARLYGVPLPATAGEHVSVLDARDRRRAYGLTCHKAPRARVAEIGGVRVSEPGELFLELSGLLSLPDLVAAGDHLAQHGWLTPEALQAFCAGVSDRGIGTARSAASHVRAGAESPMESKARLLLALAGFPEPEINPSAVDVRGARRRYDLVFREARLLVEYDGRQHAEDPHQWLGDLARREAMDEDDWRLLVLTARDIYVTPDATVLKVWRLLRERGQPGLPERPHDLWRCHFPTRDPWRRSA